LKDESSSNPLYIYCVLLWDMLNNYNNILYELDDRQREKYLYDVMTMMFYIYMHHIINYTRRYAAVGIGIIVCFHITIFQN